MAAMKAGQITGGAGRRGGAPGHHRRGLRAPTSPIALGHGIGIKGPRASLPGTRATTPVLEAGMTFTVEPSIRVPHLRQPGWKTSCW